ncbi:MAG TPA: DUF1624 domain-containing protein [Rhodobacteraceae bacterium]|nr:DUF1624 domain-containing protein [Paracoccaceae bacterium]
MRLHGLDLARFFALFGMVVVNFKVASGAIVSGDVLPAITGAFEGRAAATFVVLAGIGLGLSARKSINYLVIFKRAAFLMVIGLLNMLIFDADIIHYYAVYFLFGALFLRANLPTLITAIIALNLIALTLLLGLDFDSGWNWDTYQYSDFWTLSGFTRNLFYNGWHPVFPWLSFLLFGLILARLDLSAKAIQLRLIAWGLSIWAAAEILSAALQAWAGGAAELVILVQTSPVPAVPLYIIAGAGAASTVIGACLLLGDRLRPLAVTGRQTLSLYFGHIFIGMGVMQATGLLAQPPLWQAVVASLLFTLLAVIYANIWVRIADRGPVEAIMRRIAG